ncbi:MULTISPECIES: helix-turn-helix domain-containing protein [Paraburkholderia]|uniref:helix-turn-helix domain-containing protein n=1 Tax=Paraburkholderia TaxID=1822464 RepID=UPI002259AAC8|nr:MULTISPECIES: helix-turn-helix domain-containing protein [Paraburkholderia]MCX4154973.1 helix-turn-helix domain-containing protein [Paraburkholderia aspalathi]MDN7164383.1 helix-turn-helix domain-containing protein [Paraburkholderia sp. SECH2]MDQ6392868.1 helix-turn-helix domain-containing protein [Paraburkholderia aspalathi]
MSVILVDLAFEQNVKTSAKTILVYMAWRADETGRCWPSIKELQRVTRITSQAVYTAINTLEAAGLITRENRTPNTNLYRLHLSGAAE